MRRSALVGGNSDSRLQTGLDSEIAPTGMCIKTNLTAKLTAMVHRKTAPTGAGHSARKLFPKLTRMVRLKLPHRCKFNGPPGTVNQLYRIKFLNFIGQTQIEQKKEILDLRKSLFRSFNPLSGTLRGNASILLHTVCAIEFNATDKLCFYFKITIRRVAEKSPSVSV